MKSLVDYIKEQFIDEARTIKSFKKNSLGEFRQLLEHLCLCFYSKLYINNRCYDHWLGECANFANTATEQELKGGTKSKIIKRIFAENSFRDKKTLLKLTRKKIVEEEHVKKDIQEILVDLLISHIDELIDILIDIDEDTIRDVLDNYIHNITKHQKEND